MNHGQLHIDFATFKMMKIRRDAYQIYLQCIFIKANTNN